MRRRAVPTTSLLLVVSLVLGCTAPPQATPSAPPTPAPTPAPTPREPREWQDESIYFVMTDRFRNGDPSNDGDARAGDPRWWQGGDLRGVIEKLPYITELGMTAIWITPVTAQTRGGYHGYWTNDFYAVDPHLGDLATLKELVTKSHARGLRVILDIVLNHVGYDHLWLAERPSWFHERCEIFDADPRSVEQCWLAGLPDLNTEFPEVKRHLFDWSVWLARESGVDGYRLDTARHLPREFIAEWKNALERTIPGFWVVGEVFTSDYSEQAPYFTEAKLDALTDFQTYDSIRLALGGDRADLRRLAFPPPLAEHHLARPQARATFIDNHDVPRFVGSATPDEERRVRLQLALAYLFTAPGIPVLYYGTEIGLPGGGDPDNRRAMPWDDASGSALRDHTARLARLRQDEAVLRRGGFERISADADHILYVRRRGDELAVVGLNVTGEVVALALPTADLKVPAGKALRPAFGTEQIPRAEGADVVVEIPSRGAAVWIARAGS
jgi:alpha-amylase